MKLIEMGNLVAILVARFLGIHGGFLLRLPLARIHNFLQRTLKARDVLLDPPTWCLMGSRRKIVEEKSTSCTTLNGPRMEDAYSSHSVLCTLYYRIYMDLKQFGQLCFVNWMSLSCHLPNSGSWWNLPTPWAKSSFETFWPSWWRRASWTSMVLAAWWISGMPQG